MLGRVETRPTGTGQRSRIQSPLHDRGNVSRHEGHYLRTRPAHDAHLHADRRDRLLLLIAIAQGLLTLLSAASEACGLDRLSRRTQSSGERGHYSTTVSTGTAASGDLPCARSGSNDCLALMSAYFASIGSSPRSCDLTPLGAARMRGCFRPRTPGVFNKFLRARIWLRWIRGPVDTHLARQARRPPTRASRRG